MSKLLSEWSPSVIAIDLLKLNGMSDVHIENSVSYLKAQKELENIDDVEGYDTWNAFFIMFCIKASGQNEE
jgi:hypothetical protein